MTVVSDQPNHAIAPRSRDIYPIFWLVYHKKSPISGARIILKL
jgi:hypothetical protein